VEKLSEITFRRFILSVFSKVNDEHDIWDRRFVGILRLLWKSYVGRLKMTEKVTNKLRIVEYGVSEISWEYLKIEKLRNVSLSEKSARSWYSTNHNWRFENKCVWLIDEKN
jgi:hypothetical protein